MDIVRNIGPVPSLRRPVLVVAFAGWNDAGECASSALETLEAATEATPFADLDPEDFFDFQVARPVIRDGAKGHRELEWPRNQFAWAHLPGTERDVVILHGTEPNLRWRTFAEAVLEVVQRLGVELVVTLGALQIDVPHTRPTPLSGSATDPDLAARIGLRRSGYEGPTGITGVLHHATERAGVPGVSLWAGVPHYLAGASFAAGTLALAETVVQLLGADLALDALAREAVSQRDEIAELVAEDDDLARYVADLETRVDTEGPLDVAAAEGDLPSPDVSGDELAAELERFLRDRDR